MPKYKKKKKKFKKNKHQKNFASFSNQLVFPEIEKEFGKDWKIQQRKRKKKNLKEKGKRVLWNGENELNF